MILMFGGTSDSSLLAGKLNELGHEVLLSTLTEYGSKCAASNYNGKVIYGSMDREKMLELILREHVSLILDATHPFAVNISQLAMEVADASNISYMRYERPVTDMSYSSDLVHLYNNYEEMIDELSRVKGSILLTIGSRQLHKFSREDIRERIIARILPSSKYLAEAEEQGFLPKQILAMQGPFSEGLNREIILNYDICHLVTKDSGDAGKTKEKIDAALKIGCHIHILMRPKLDYKNVYKDMESIIQAIQRG